MQLIIENLQKIEYKEYLNYNYIEKLDNKEGYIVGKLCPNLDVNSKDFKVIYKMRYGIINNDGRILIPVIYDKIYGFKNNISLAQLKDNFHYFDIKGQQLETEEVSLETRGYLRTKLSLFNNPKNIDYDIHIVRERLITYDKKVELFNEIKNIPQENIISNEKVGYLVTLEIDERNKKYYISPKDPTKYNSSGMIIELNNNLQEVIKDNENNIIIKQKVIK